MESIFEHWTKKVEHRQSDGEGGFCANGWLWHIRGDSQVTAEAQFRIGRWIQQNLEPPSRYRHRGGAILFPDFVPTDAIVWANNEMKLDIEGFKMVDLLTQGYLPEESVIEELEERTAPDSTAAVLDFVPL